MAETQIITPDQVTQIIANQNDAFRRAILEGGTPLVPGHILLTSGVRAQEVEIISEAIRAVARFSDFNADNDPYGDRSFGRIVVGDVSFFWKIDLYDENYEHGSSVPESTEKTRRVLTIMLPVEY